MRTCLACSGPIEVPQRGRNGLRCHACFRAHTNALLSARRSKRDGGSAERASAWSAFNAWRLPPGFLAPGVRGNLRGGL